jgi:hypothetical protein
MRIEPDFLGQTEESEEIQSVLDTLDLNYCVIQVDIY